MKNLLSPIFLSFTLFFLTKEFFLFNPELVFIVSFLLFFFVALDNVSDVITDTLDKREQEIRAEFHGLLLQKLTVLSKTHSVIQNLCFTSSHLLRLTQFMGNYTKFLSTFTRQLIKANRRQSTLLDTVYIFKNAVNLARFINENNIRRLALRTRTLMKRKLAVKVLRKKRLTKPKKEKKGKKA